MIDDRDYGPRYYDREGLPITAEGWCRLHADREYAIIAQTQFIDVLVSTVWLGLDHGLRFMPGWEYMPPIIFETMIFGGEHDEYQERYANEDDALRGHERAVELVRTPTTTSAE